MCANEERRRAGSCYARFAKNQELPWTEARRECVEKIGQLLLSLSFSGGVPRMLYAGTAWGHRKMVLEQRDMYPPKLRSIVDTTLIACKSQ